MAAFVSTYAGGRRRREHRLHHVRNSLLLYRYGPPGAIVDVDLCARTTITSSMAAAVLDRGGDDPPGAPDPCGVGRYRRISTTRSFVELCSLRGSTFSWRSP